MTDGRERELPDAVTGRRDAGSGRSRSGIRAKQQRHEGCTVIVAPLDVECRRCKPRAGQGDRSGAIGATDRRIAHHEAVEGQYGRAGSGSGEGLGLEDVEIIRACLGRTAARLNEHHQSERERYPRPLPDLTHNLPPLSGV